MIRSLLRSGKWYRSLVVWTIVITWGIVASVAVYTYLQYRQATAESVIERDRHLAFLSAARLRDELSNFSDVLVSLSRTPEISEGDLVQKRRALQAASNRLAVFDGGTVLLNNFGRVQATVPLRQRMLGVDWSHRDFFQSLLITPDVYISDVQSSEEDGTLVVAISVPVLGPRGEFVGALAGMFRLGQPTVSAFYANIVRLRIGQSGGTYLVDGTGRILYDAAANRVGEKLVIGGLNFADDSISAGAIRTRDTEGNDVVAAYAPVPGTSWTLVTEEDWDLLTRSTQQYAQTLLLSLVVGMLLPPLGLALLVRRSRQEQFEREQLAREERIARLIRWELLPRQYPILPGWDLKAEHRLGKEGGRDFHDAVILPDGRLMLLLGSVNERGIPAAIAAASTRAILRAAAQERLPAGKALERCNNSLLLEAPPGLTVALQFALLDPVYGLLCCAAAGHYPPCTTNDDDEVTGSSLQFAREAGPGTLSLSPPLAVESEQIYPESKLCLERGQFAVFFGPGVIEARNLRAEAFGIERLLAILKRPHENAEALLQAILADLEAFCSTRWAATEDVTLLVLERLADRDTV